MKTRVSVWLIALLFLLTGCAQAQRTTSDSSSTADMTRVSSKRSVQSKRGQKIIVTIQHKKLTAHLNQSSAAKAFARELPLTLSFRDYPGLPEKIADFDHRLPTNGMPSGHAGTRGSIGYWSPQQRIVFYWGTEDYYEGIHIIGKFDTNAYRQVVRGMGNHVQVKITEAPQNK